MTTRTHTWESLPKIGDGHRSNHERMVIVGTDENHDLIWDGEPVPCGAWHDGHQRYCDGHEALYESEYPQGWAYYPGDICPHGRYVGGSGVDLMCINCELGDDY
jgi:hypothetical protein